MTPMTVPLGSGGVGTPPARVVVKHPGGTATTVSSLLPSSIIKTEVKTEIKTEPEEAIVIDSDSDSEHAQRPSKPSTPGPVNVNVNVNLNFQEVPPGFDFLMRGRASSTSSQQGDGKYTRDHSPFIVTARIRRMGEGYIFSLCVSPHGRGGTYLRADWGRYLPSSRLKGGGGYLPSSRQVGVPTFQLTGGTYLTANRWGYLPSSWQGGTYLTADRGEWWYLPSS